MSQRQEGGVGGADYESSEGSPSIADPKPRGNNPIAFSQLGLIHYATKIAHYSILFFPVF